MIAARTRDALAERKADGVKVCRATNVPVGHRGADGHADDATSRLLELRRLDLDVFLPAGAERVPIVGMRWGRMSWNAHSSVMSLSRRVTPNNPSTFRLSRRPDLLLYRRMQCCPQVAWPAFPAIQTSTSKILSSLTDPLTFDVVRASCSHPLKTRPSPTWRPSASRKLAQKSCPRGWCDVATTTESWTGISLGRFLAISLLAVVGPMSS